MAFGLTLLLTDNLVRNMNRTRFIGLSLGVVALLAPTLAFADNPRILVRTQTESGDSKAPSATIRVEAHDPSLGSSPGSQDTLYFTADFDGEERTVVAHEGSYDITVDNEDDDYSYTYSSDCDGDLDDNETHYCTITAHEDDNDDDDDRDSTLTVYVNVNNYGGTNASPDDFRIRISGNDPSRTSFDGSGNGTRVHLDSGYFSVSASDNPVGWQAQYSGNCSGNIGRNQSLSCTVTFASAGFQPYPGYPYYPGQQVPGAPLQGLTCAPAFQQTTVGSTMTFTASGGTGVYSWGTTNQGLVDGPIFVWRASSAGQHPVVVTSGGRSAVCNVQVIGAGPAGYQYPKLPKTGYDPNTGVQYALAVALLAAFGAGVYFAVLRHRNFYGRDAHTPHRR
jgi:hypothetical protein